MDFRWFILFLVCSMVTLVVWLSSSPIEEHSHKTTSLLTYKRKSVTNSISSNQNITNTNNTEEFQSFNKSLMLQEKGTQESSNEEINNVVDENLEMLSYEEMFQEFKPTNYTGFIYLDWVLDSEKLNYINYKSLESLLFLYPNAKFRVFLLSPDNSVFYKYGQLLSLYYFQKYEKKGYNFKMLLRHETYRKISKKLIQEKEIIDIYPLGNDYWKAEMNKCCVWNPNSKNGISQRRYVPTHLYFYNRILTIYETGGLFSDFFWFHVKPIKELLSSDQSEIGGVFIRIDCGIKQIPNIDITQEKCVSSSLLAFSKNHSVPLCMLKHYNDSNSSLRKCFLDHESLNGGAHCIRQEFDKCFHSLGIKNQFIPFHDSFHSVEKLDTFSSTEGRRLTNEKVKIPVNIKFSPSSSNKDTEINLQTHFQNNPKLSPIRSKPTLTSLQNTENDENANFDSKHLESDIISCPIVRLPENIPINDNSTEITSFSVMCRFSEGNQHKYLWSSSTTLTEDYKIWQNLTKTQNTFFLGSASFSGLWELPDPDSPLSYLIHQLQLELQRRDKHQLEVNLQLQHGKFNLNFSLPECHEYLGFRSDPIRFRRQGRTSCAPHFILAGFMKAGSTNLFGRIMKNSRTLRALRGVSFKETGCYMPNELKNNNRKFRMNCFPFVEKYENYYFGDGTVYYAAIASLPEFLKKENPRIKVLFSVRDPIKRTESQHKFFFNQLSYVFTGDINVCLDLALDKTHGSILWYWHKLAYDVLNEKNLVERKKKELILIKQFQKGIYNTTHDKYKHVQGLIVHSLYIPPILHWANNLNPKQILVVPGERLDVQRLTWSEKKKVLKTLVNENEYKKILKENFNIFNKSINMENKRIKEHIKKMADDFFTSKTSLYQVNSIYRFLEIPEVGKLTRLSDSDVHKTREKRVKSWHTLNETMLSLLREFYFPFNALLDQFLYDSLGYNDIINHNIT